MDRAMNPLACLVCHGPLEHAFPDTVPDRHGYVENQPSDGVAFETAGNYGSTAYDQLDGERLQIAVCDTCLRANAAYTRRVTRTVGPLETHVVAVGTLPDRGY
jgi:hypothetical protein